MPVFARLISALALGCILLMAGSPLAASEAGRDFSECVRACNGVRVSCVDQCLIDCRSIFPQNSSQRGACMSSCTRTCVKNASECRLDCKAIKNGESPTKP